MTLLALDQLKEGMVSAQTICAPNGTMLIAKGVTLKQTYIDRLTKLGIKGLIVDDAEQREFSSLVLSSQSLKAIQKLLETPAVIEAFNTANSAFSISQVLGSIFDNPFVDAHLKSLVNNSAIYQHSLRVTIMTLQLGLSYGYDYLNLEYLGICALLHDIGLTDDTILDLPTPNQLGTDNEWTAHAVDGFKILRADMDLDMIVALVALQHHEHFDGHGTPFGLCKSQITEFSSIVALADFYDRLVFFMNNSRAQAVFKILDRNGTQFDPAIVSLFEAAIIK